MLLQVEEMQTDQVNQQKASLGFSKDEIKDINKMQSLVAKFSTRIEKDPELIGYKTPQGNKIGDVSKFSITTMKNPQDTASQVSAAKPVTPTITSISQLLASLERKQC